MSDALLPETLDQLVSRVDHERWLATRFVADEDARADLIALYAFNHELAHAAEVASQPLVGEIRLAWWTEVLDEIFGGKRVRGHPGARSLAVAVERRRLERAPLEALIDARLRDLDGWPLKPGELQAYVDATRGGVMRIAAEILAPGAPMDAVAPAAQAWGLAGLARSPGRLTPDDEQEAARQVRAALKEANRRLRRFPTPAFPAVAYAVLAPQVVQGRTLTDLERRARLTWAVLRGRL
jgi:phytoene synthase